MNKEFLCLVKKIVFLKLLFSLLCMVSLCFQGCDSGDDSEEESASSEDPIEEVDDSTVKATAKKASKAVGAKKAIASNNVQGTSQVVGLFKKPSKLEIKKIGKKEPQTMGLLKLSTGTAGLSS